VRRSAFRRQADHGRASHEPSLMTRFERGQSSHGCTRLAGRRPISQYTRRALGWEKKLMKRREVISLLAGAMAALHPIATRAQQPAKMARLGYLAPARLSNLIEALLAGLRDFGYVEGQNLKIEYRFALGQTKSYDELAQELVRLDPAAIVLTGTP